MLVTLEKAISILNSGGIVAVPTETVYGLAALLNKPHAIQKIFDLKKRPQTNPLIIHIANTQDLKPYVKEYPPLFTELTRAFWPGPLTCILPIHKHLIPTAARASLPTAAFRVPSPQVTCSLIEACGPIVMPSANLSGKPSATLPQHIEHDFGPEFPILQGSPHAKGLESTIVLYRNTEWVIARQGAISQELFTPILGYEPAIIEKETAPLCPGQHFRHYAPKAKLFLHPNKEAPVILGFIERSYPKGKEVLYLGSLLSPEIVAKNLYDILRSLDLKNITLASIDMDFPRYGLWLTIAERLMRAAESGDSLKSQ